MAHDPNAFGSGPITGDFDLIVYGHTHIQEIRRDGNTLVINPGHSWAVILDLDNMNYETIYLD
jgi:predicted phosphodiesterase